MKRRHLVGILSILAATLLLAGCEDLFSETDEPEDGAITINLTSATISDPERLWVYVYEADEPDVNDPTAVLGAGSAVIIGGAATVQVMVADDAWGYTTETWDGTAEESYDAYIYTCDANNEPDGTDYMTDPMPMEIEIDGDVVIDIDFADMEPYAYP